MAWRPRELLDDVVILEFLMVTSPLFVATTALAPETLVVMVAPLMVAEESSPTTTMAELVP